MQNRAYKDGDGNMTSTVTKKLSISLPEKAQKALDKIAEEKTVTRSALIRIAVAEYIKKEEGAGKIQ